MLSNAWFKAWIMKGEEKMFEVIKDNNGRFRIMHSADKRMSYGWFYTAKSAKHHMKKGKFKLSPETYTGV